MRLNLKLFLLLALLPLAFSLSAANKQRVKDLDIQITLLSKGGIVVCETWDINTGDDITEWYLVRKNLGDIKIRNFAVIDEKDPDVRHYWSTPTIRARRENGLWVWELRPELMDAAEKVLREEKFPEVKRL